MNKQELLRFQKFIELDLLSGCWLWKGFLTQGYGRMKINGKSLLVHRLAFLHWNDQIPRELQLDHLCRNRSCVNPEHLEIVTNQENCRRGEKYTKQFCKNGHPRISKNLYVKPSGNRDCRICTNLRTTKWRKNNPEKRLESQRKYRIKKKL